MLNPKKSPLQNRKIAPSEGPIPIYEEFSKNIIQLKYFRFQTFEEGRRTAQYISDFCPNPLKAEAGLNELFMNAIEHGNLGITYEEKNNILTKNKWLSTVHERLFLPENRGKQVKVVFEKTIDAITIFIKDCGQGFNWRPFLSHHNKFNYNGRGIMIAKQYAFDEVNYNNPGNEVTCRIYKANSGA